MALDSNAALVSANHLFDVANKLAHVPLDGGPSMLERARTGVNIDWMRHSVFAHDRVFEFSSQY